MLRILGKPKQGWDLKILKTLSKQECKSSNTRLGNTYFSYALKKYQNIGDICRLSSLILFGQPCRFESVFNSYF